MNFYRMQPDRKDIYQAKRKTQGKDILETSKFIR